MSRIKRSFSQGFWEKESQDYLTGITVSEIHFFSRPKRTENVKLRMRTLLDKEWHWHVGKFACSEKRGWKFLSSRRQCLYFNTVVTEETFVLIKGQWTAKLAGDKEGVILPDPTIAYICISSVLTTLLELLNTWPITHDQFSRTIALTKINP